MIIDYLAYVTVKPCQTLLLCLIGGMEAFYLIHDILSPDTTSRNKAINESYLSKALFYTLLLFALLKFLSGAKIFYALKQA